MFVRSRWSRRLLPAIVALAALAWASPALATHLPGFGHSNILPAGQQTYTSCGVDTMCLWVDNSNGGDTAIAVHGGHTAATGTAPGVRGTTNSAAAYASGVTGEVGSAGDLLSAGVFGNNKSAYGQAVGVRAQVAGDGYGVYSSTGPGGWAVYGTTASNGFGVYGNINGPAAGSAAVRGHNSATGVATGTGVHGSHSGGGNGVYGSVGLSWVGAAGVLGQVFGTGVGGVGVHGHHGGGGYGVYGNAAGAGGVGVVGNQGAPTGFAGYFAGRVHITGVLTKGGGAFKIDHPLDPQNKYLQHSFVESPDMKNVYDGVVVTNRRGFATVKLPSYFSALNRDFRYQLTGVGRAAWGARMVVWREIADNRFVIRSEPNVKVSWHVTGIRKDRFANANRIQVEPAKTAAERGTYLNADLYGASAAKSLHRVPPPPGLSEARVTP